jgi:hypothetical protein
VTTRNAHSRKSEEHIQLALVNQVSTRYKGRQKDHLVAGVGPRHPWAAALQAGHAPPCTSSGDLPAACCRQGCWPPEALKAGLNRRPPLLLLGDSLCWRVAAASTKHTRHTAHQERRGCINPLVGKVKRYYFRHGYDNLAICHQRL